MSYNNRLHQLWLARFVIMMGSVRSVAVSGERHLPTQSGSSGVAPNHAQISGEIKSVSGDSATANDDLNTETPTDALNRPYLIESSPH
ncbi:hypothetical protein D3C78_1435790 [compost metagenome]